jgi:succinoglycan biosynthesis transport protein ExoP
MDFNQFMLALSARRKAFAMVLAATVVTAVVLSLLLPKVYVSTTTLLVDARDEQTMNSTPMSMRMQTGYMQTQADLMQSTRVAQKVARDLKLAQRPGMREDFERDTGGIGNIDEWIAAALLKKVKVDSSGGNVVSVSYSASDPKLATDVVNGFAKAYLETALQLRTEPTREAAEWFEEQLTGMRAQVAQAQTRLATYQKEKGLIGVDERGDVENTRLAELSTQLMAARNATYDAQTRFKQATEVVSSGAAPDQLPEIAGNTAIQGIKSELSRAQSNLEQMSAELGPNHPSFVRQQSEVTALRERLASEMKKIVSGLNNTALQSQKREQELRNAYAAQSERLSNMRDARVELSVLSREVETAQRSYDAALTRWMTNKVDSRARQTNVAVLSPAVEPITPKFPKVPLIAGLSLLVGTLFAAGVVFFLETLDRRVRSRSDLESRLAVPTLGRLSRWQPTGGRLLAAPARAAKALPHPW